MNIYDFDNTIYNGDSNIDLTLYSLIRHPFKVIKSLICCIPLYFKYKNNKISFEKFKESFLSYLFRINNLNDYIDKFVDKKMHKIKKWYVDNHKDNDTIMSASYELWIKKFCERLNIKNVIATITDDKGNIIGNNCKRKEKIKRFNKMFPNQIVENAYSDSLDDIPMFEIAKCAYLVKNNKLIKYK